MDLVTNPEEDVCTLYSYYILGEQFHFGYNWL